MEVDWEAELASTDRAPEPDVQFSEGCDACGGHISWIDVAWLRGEDTLCHECAIGIQFYDCQKRLRRTQKVGN